MARLKHNQTGVVVSVDDATAARLGADYSPLAAPRPEVDSKPDAKPEPKRRAPARKKKTT